MESFGKTNGTFVKYFPASTLMFINMGVKGDGLYNLLSENKEFRSTVSIAKADEVKELFNSFNGDISAGLINVTMNSAPTFLAYADVKNGNALEALYKNKQSLGMRKGEDIMELGKDEYVYKTRGMNIFSASRTNRCMLPMTNCSTRALAKRLTNRSKTLLTQQT